VNDLPLPPGKRLGDRTPSGLAKRVDPASHLEEV